jgi:hypothetical protein
MKKIILLLLLVLSNKVYSQTQEIIFGDSLQNCTARSMVYLNNTLSVLINCTDTAGIYSNYIYQFDSSGQYLTSFLIPVNNMTAERMELSGNNFLLCGSAFDSTGDAQAVLLMIDTTFNIKWFKEFGILASDESFRGACTLPDGSIAGSGITRNPSGSGNAYYTVKTDSAGNNIWEQTYSTSFNSYSDAVFPLSDGTMVISGDRANAAGLYTNTTIRIDSSGSIVWELESTNPNNNGCKNDMLTSDGNILVVGESATAANFIFDPLISKVDSSGNEVWSYIYSGSPGSTDVLYDICEINSNSFIAAGLGAGPGTGSLDILVIGIDSAGTELFRSYIGDTSGIDKASDIMAAEDHSGIYICGSTFRNNKTRAYLVYRTLAALQSVWPDYGTTYCTAYPNPSSGKIHISGIPVEHAMATVINMQGENVPQKQVQDGVLDISPLPDGLYIVRIVTRNRPFISRINVIH